MAILKTHEKEPVITGLSSRASFFMWRFCHFNSNWFRDRKGLEMANKEIGTTTVGGRIQKLREENNMTQAALAEELHLENKSSISRYESNRSTPTPELFVEMARLFGTTTDYILSGEMPARSSKLMQAEAILQGMKLDKTLDAAITMLMTLKGLEQ